MATLIWATLSHSHRMESTLFLACWTGQSKSGMWRLEKLLKGPKGTQWFGPLCHIVSGLQDKTIQVWNTETEEVVVGPLERHTDSVSSVLFSQDGKCIV